MTEKHLSPANKPIEYLSVPMSAALWAATGALIGAAAFLLGFVVHPLAGVVLVVIAITTLVLLLYADLPETLSTIRDRLRRGEWQAVVAENRWIIRLVSTAALGLLIVAATAYSRGKMTQLPLAASTLLTAGFLVLIVVTLQQSTVGLNTAATRAVSRGYPRHRTRWLPLLMGVGLIAIMAEINGNVFDPPFLRRITVDTQFIILCTGIALTGWGLAGYVPAAARQDAPTQPRPLPDWREWLAVATILLVALAARLWQLEDAVRLFVDEIHFANPIIHFYWADDIELMRPFSSVAAFPYLFPYMQWHIVDVVGRNLVGLRLLSVFLGVINVWALYLLAKELFGTRTALLAAALLAVFPPHLQFSRLGLNNIADPVFGTLAVYFIARGMNPAYRMRPNFAWAGVMIGCTQYFYEGGRLLYPALIFGWLALIGVGVYAWLSGRYVWARWWQHRRMLYTTVRQINAIDGRRLKGAVIVLVLAAIVVSIPVYYTLVAQERSLLVRLETAGLSERTTRTLNDTDDYVVHLLDRMEEAFLIHVAIPEAGLYYAGTEGFIIGSVLPFFFFGLYVLLFRLDRRAALPVLLWVVLTWLGNTLMQESRISARYVVVFPALMLVTAVGVNSIATLFWQQIQRQNRVVTGLVSALMVIQVVYYFGPHLDTFNRQFRVIDERVLDSHDVLFRAAQLPPQTRVHLVGYEVMPNHDADQLLRYLADDIHITTLPPPAFDDDYLTMAPVNFDHAFFIDEQDSRMLDRLLNVYPDIEGPFYSGYERVPRDRQFAMYFLPRAIDLTQFTNSSP